MPHKLVANGLNLFNLAIWNLIFLVVSE
jgi:hypothetical protein